MTTPTSPLDFNPVIRDFKFDAPLSQRVAGLIHQLVTSQQYVLGADLSHWNTSVDMVKLNASGYKFVILKATEALNYVDPTFQTRWQQALDAGMIVGTYHFFRSQYDGVQQADHHLRTIEPLMNKTFGKIIPPVNDVETPDGVTVSVRQPRVQAWNSKVKVSLGVKPVCYSSPYAWSSLMANMSMDCTGFTAHWTGALQPMWPVGWPTADRLFWQYGVYPKYSWALPVPQGVVGECDLIRFYGTMTDLRALTGDVDYTHDEKVEILWADYLTRREGAQYASR